MISKNKKYKTIYYSISSELITKTEIEIIKRASKYGRVIIGLLTDSAIAEYKRIPFLGFKERYDIISNIKLVSEVVPQESRDYTYNLKKIRPDYIIHEDNDWKIGIQKKIRENVIRTIKKWKGKLIEVKINQISKEDYTKNKIGSVNHLPEYRVSKLKRLMEVKDLVKIIEVHSPISALMIEELKIERNNRIQEFDGFWSSSLTDSVLRGKPDTEVVDISTRLQSINDIFEVTTKPLVFDADTGGKIDHIGYSIRNLERLGVSAVIIEDKIGLKRNSLFGNSVKQKQDTISSFCKKIKTAKKEQKTEDFMVIARIESLILDAGVDDALLRAKRYIQAGADAIMIHSRQKTLFEIKKFCKKYNQLKSRKPLVLVPTTYNFVKESELIKLRVNLVIYANHLMRSSIPAMEIAATSILKNKRSFEIENKLMSINKIINMIPGV